MGDLGDLGDLSIKEMLVPVLAGGDFPALVLSFFDEQPIITHTEREIRRM